MANMRAITLHCHEKLERDTVSGRDDRVWQMPRIIKARNGDADFITDEKGDVWRVITRILSAHAFDTAQGPEHALECGATLGHFHYLLSDMDPALIVDPLPGFHVTSGYLAHYDETLFQAFMRGYMKEAGAFLTDADRAYLYDAIRLLPFELGLRFFQDYLAGDKYFKVRQPEQNLNRARVQFRLCESIEAREKSIRDALNRL